MKKIVSVEINEFEITIHGEAKIFFSKKEYVDKIEISKIKRIDKIYERSFNENVNFTGIRFYRNLEDVLEDKSKEEIENIIKEIDDDDLVAEFTEEVTLLYEIPAYRYNGSIQELFDYMAQSIDMEKIEINEIVL